MGTSGRWRRGTGRETGPSRVRPMDQPRRVEVEVDAHGSPVAVRGRRGRVAVLATRESWRIDDEWWRTPISRHYFEVILESGRPLLLYRDRVEERWYFQ